jgi:hypothetical protein
MHANTQGERVVLGLVDCEVQEGDRRKPGWRTGDCNECVGVDEREGDH